MKLFSLRNAKDIEPELREIGRGKRKTQFQGVNVVLIYQSQDETTRDSVYADINLKYRPFIGDFDLSEGDDIGGDLGDLPKLH